MNNGIVLGINCNIIDMYTYLVYRESEMEKVKVVIPRGVKGCMMSLLKGELKGLRSIRLNRSWRLYYKEIDGIPKIISIEKIDKHEY